MNLNAEFKSYVAGRNVTDKKMKLTFELDVDIKPAALAAITQMVSKLTKYKERVAEQMCSGDTA
ncbi:hypothetical protein DFP93_12241 [Aneurinibacillus soli]|uniref:Uncharacterized protein n=1 Tax=Aneurinibacillus soli TaxID=1500254 RepID=A0A0U5CA59_9BACL|nr:hypothetical protein [Aneurinibacillus soli]PYE58637.1 hypothetical protein DFP93_12241 [Aneurinibacillus soli]BAU29603.1 hypothetical protein CB4_03814 [Aneurinibacillus soli]